MLTRKHFIAGLLAIAFASLAIAQPSVAGGILDQTGCSCCCPVCDHVCKLEAKEGEEERTCFEVETKVICIPRVVFPWQKAKKAHCASCDACDGRGCTACVHNGARVRKICVAKPKKYTCPACKYTWTAEKKNSCCGDCCDGDSCDNGYIIAAPAVHAAPAPPAPVAQTWESEDAYNATSANGHADASNAQLIEVEPTDADSAPMPPAPKAE